MRLALLVLLAATTAASAGERNELTLGPGTRALRSNSANAVTSDSLITGALTYGRRLDLVDVPRLQTWVTGAFSWGAADGELFHMVTEIDTVAFTAGARARYVLHRNLAVGARVDLGTARTALAVEAGYDHVTDAGWGATLGAAVGADLYAIAHPKFSLGFRFELGYVTMTAPALSPAKDTDDSMILLTGSQASIGHLDLGGRYYTVAMVAQF
jgi:hypothetical protein